MADLFGSWDTQEVLSEVTGASMQVRHHPKIRAWPPQPGGTNVTAERPQAESQPTVTEVHVNSVTDKSIPLSCEFKGNLFTYDVQTSDRRFAKELAELFSHNTGCTLSELGDLDISF